MLDGYCTKAEKAWHLLPHSPLLRMLLHGQTQIPCYCGIFMGICPDFMGRVFPREFYMHACSFLDYVCMGKLFNKGGLRKTVIISRAEHVLAAGWAFKKAKRDSDCEDRKFGGKLNSGKNALAQKWRKVRNWKIRKTLKPVVMYHLLVRTSDPRADPGHLYSSKWCSTDWLLRLGHFLFFLLCSIDCFLNESWVSFPSN